MGQGVYSVLCKGLGADVQGRQSVGGKGGVEKRGQGVAVITIGSRDKGGRRMGGRGGLDAVTGGFVCICADLWVGSGRRGALWVGGAAALWWAPGRHVRGQRRVASQLKKGGSGCRRPGIQRIGRWSPSPSGPGEQYRSKCGAEGDGVTGRKNASSRVARDRILVYRAVPGLAGWLYMCWIIYGRCDLHGDPENAAARTCGQ